MIEGYTLAQARDFYTATYGAGRARLYVVGSFDAAAMETSIRKAFGAWSKGLRRSQCRPGRPAAEACT